jgi:hypothetical protein
VRWLCVLIWLEVQRVGKSALAVLGCGVGGVHG